MKMKRLIFFSMVFLLTLFLSVPAIHALPTRVNSYNSIFFENAEVFINNVGAADTVDVGDVFWGVFNVQNFKDAGSDASGQTGPNFWLSGGTKGDPVEITGYFATVVTAVTPIPGDPVNSILDLGPTADPNGILAAGEVMAFFTDITNNFDTSSQALGLATSTDGTPAWTLGQGASTDGDSAGGYWYSVAPAAIPISGDVGISYAGLNFINPDGSMFLAIDDPNEINLGDPLVEFWFNSEIFVINGGPQGANAATLFHFGSNDPAVFFPIPEPGTIFLLGAGMIGLAAVTRKRFSKKG